MSTPTLEDLVDALERAVDSAETSASPMLLAPLCTRVAELQQRLEVLNQKCMRITMNTMTLSDDGPVQQRNRSTDSSDDDDGELVARTYDEAIRRGHSTARQIDGSGVLGWMVKAAASLVPSARPGAMEASPASGISTVAELVQSLTNPVTLKRLADMHLRQTFDSIETYYAARPELALYTLNCELTRMEYLVITEDGSELKDANSIRKHYNSGEVAESTPACACEECEMLWRMANQSVFASLLEPLSTCWLVPELGSAISVARCQLELDLRSKSLLCTCVLLITCECCSERLELATCNGTISVNLDRRDFAPSIEPPHMCTEAQAFLDRSRAAPPPSPPQAGATAATS